MQPATGLPPGKAAFAVRRSASMLPRCAASSRSPSRPAPFRMVAGSLMPIGSEPRLTLSREDRPMSDDRINWSNDPDVVLRRRYATAIYINADGDITLRQERWPDEDVCIVVPVE